MHTCQRCGKQLSSPQSLWNHKQRCERYGPPDDLHNVTVAEKRKAVVMYDACKRPRTKGDIVGYSDDDGDVQEKSKFDGVRKANTLAVLDRIVNSTRKPSPAPSASRVISKISVLPSGIVKDTLESTTSKGKGLWSSRGRGIEEVLAIR